MNLYLVRHAEAKNEGKDPSLSEGGLQDIKKVTSYILQMRIRVDQIFHSHKLRARQTAGILNESLKSSKGFTEADGLDPLDDPVIWSERLKSIADTIVLVGHLPHLGKLASLLLCGDMNRNLIAFKPAGVVYLKREDRESWALEWMLVPEVVLLPKLVGFP